MRRFLVRLAGFLALQAGLATPVAIRMARQPASDTFLSANLRKHHRLNHLPPPRLVFVGGSATAFGVDSPAIEKALGIPVVNMGLYLPLGIDFMLSEVEDELRSGDVVVVSMEYSLLFMEASPDALRQMVAANPRAIRWLEPAEARRSLDRMHKPLGASAKRAIHELFSGPEPGAAAVPPYTLDSFNEHGDVVAHHDLRPGRIEQGPYGLGPPDHPVFRKHLYRLDRFYRNCASRGVTALYSYPATVQESIDTQRMAFDFVNQALEADLQMPKLHGPQEMIFPSSLFFDSKEHLTFEGKKKRTEILIRRLTSRLKHP